MAVTYRKCRKVQLLWFAAIDNDAFKNYDLDHALNPERH